MKQVYFAFTLTLLLVNSLLGQNKTVTGKITNTVCLHTGTTSFPENVKSNAAAAVVDASEMIEGFYYRMLQFQELPNADGFKDLDQNEIKLLEYIPHNTYVAAIHGDFDHSKLERLGVRSIQRITPALKQSNDLRNGNLPDWAVEKEQALLMMKFYKNLKYENILRYCETDGIQVLRSNGYNNFLRIKVPIERIQKIAELPYVAFLALAPEPDVPDDIPGRSLHRSNTIDTQFPSGRHYDGKGVNVLVRDDGVIGPHIDFKGRVDNSFVDIPNYSADHGDLVAGIIGGAGNLHPYSKGMAAGSFIYAINYVPDFLDATMDLFFNHNVIVTNSSYSEGCNAGYTMTSEIVDQQLNENPTLMHVFSAGNSGDINCGYGAGNQWGNITGGHKQAKNCITTANLYADAKLDIYSSRGPAHDGRIKPDIAANGAGQLTTGTNNTYLLGYGSSAAAPGITGILVQLHQAYSELNNGETANASLLKAILLNTANDLGNTGPDYKFGWGHVNAYRAVLTLEEGRHLAGTVEPGQTNTHSFTIPTGVRQANFMVYWSDPEGTVMTTKALVNDIDISMTDPLGNIDLPWLLNPTPNPTVLNTPAGNGIDTLNNMEQVSISNPDEGLYLLNVKGKELPFGGHSYFVVWEYRTAEITLTHPIGGESFAPGESIRIHWDAEGNEGTFEIYFSSDNGTGWIPVASVPGSQRMMDLTMPNQITGQAKIKVERAGEYDTSDEVFSIAPWPKNLTVEKACPDFIRFKWDPVVLDSAEVTSYQVMTLGDKYMEPIDTVTNSFYELPTIDMNPTNDHWFAVTAMAAGGIISQRDFAINHNAGLFNCPLDHDVSMVSINSPSNVAFFNCDDLHIQITITVKNTGLSPESNVSVAYQFENGPPIVESIPGTIAVGDTAIFTFTTLLDITAAGNYSLMAYSNLSGDLAIFNNIAHQVLSVIDYPGNSEPLEYIQDFQGQVLPPPYYLFNNPDSSYSWFPIKVIGSEGDSTFCMAVNNYSYNPVGAKDDMIVVPIDLTDAMAPQLGFDVAYASFDELFQDSLIISISLDCGATFTDVIFNKFGAQLATANTSAYFFPKASQWRNEVIDLSNYVGNHIVLKFTNVCGNGNLLYVDNIAVKEAMPSGTNTWEPRRISARISPNPNPGVFNLILRNYRAETIYLELLDSRGSVYEKRTIQTAGHQTNERYVATNLPAGVYFLKIRSEDVSMVLKVLVE